MGHWKFGKKTVAIVVIFWARPTPFASCSPKCK